jgi:hypothetical protein
MPGKSVASKLRHRVYLVARGHCAACGNTVALGEMHCDHILSVAGGGPDDWENLRCLCVNCHKLRQGGSGYTKYDRRLECGCFFSVWHRYTQADAPDVLRYLKIESPHRTRRPILLIPCSKHIRMRWSQWLKFLGNPLPIEIPVGSLAQLRKFIRSVNECRSVQ